MAQKNQDNAERVDISPAAASAVSVNGKTSSPVHYQSDASIRSMRSGRGGLALHERMASFFYMPEAQTEEQDLLSSFNALDQALMPFMIPESNTVRKVWEFLLFFVLLYVGIVFPYKLAFIDFRLSMNDDGDCADIVDGEQEDAWFYIDWFVTIFFWIDFFLYFVFTYRKDAKEECRPSRIWFHYLKGYFVVNLLACLPSEAFKPLLGALNIVNVGGKCSTTDAESVRILRLQRVTRLARLARLLRLFKIASFLKKSIGQKVLNALRSVRVLNWLVGLLWVVHLMACGWYLCAAMHTEHSLTWVGRRPIPDSSDENRSLLQEGDFVQWMHASYFVLTVFTTVGFGDMSAFTVGEIAYVCFMMMVGAIVHSIIISEMINLISEVDEGTKWRRGQVKLLKAFAKHAHFREDFTGKITDWIDNVEMGHGSYDRDELQRLITSGMIPRRLLGEMPDQLYEGALMQNKFLVTCSIGFQAQGSLAPPRFALLLSTMLQSQTCMADEIVYQMYDHAFNICLVMSGTFACVAEAGPTGGTDVMLESPEVQGGKSCARKGRRKKTLPLTRGATQALGLSKISTTGNAIADDIDQAGGIIVENPGDQARKWSSSSEPRCSSMLWAGSAWTPEGSDQSQWLQVDLGRQKPVCGVILQGHPGQEQWVTFYKVAISSNATEWFEVGATSRGCHDQDTEAHNSFNVVQARYVRIIPLNWYGGPSLRVAVLVQTSTLYPYRLFGKKSFFGDEVVLNCQRECTVRCEAEGEFLSLQKQDLMPTNCSGRVMLLAEFPQVHESLIRALRNRRQVRLRMLNRLSTKRSYRHFAAACIQVWYRKMKEEGEGALVQIEEGGHSPARRMQAMPSSRSKASDELLDRDVLQRSAVAREQMMPTRRPSSVASLHKEASRSNPMLDGGVDRVVLEAQVQKLSEDMSALRTDLTGKLDKLTSLLESRR